MLADSTQSILFITSITGVEDLVDVCSFKKNCNFRISEQVLLQELLRNKQANAYIEQVNLVTT